MKTSTSNTLAAPSDWSRNTSVSALTLLKNGTRRDKAVPSPWMSALCMLLVLTGVLPAATKTWIGATGGAWATAANWSGGVAIVAGDSAVFASATANSSTNSLTGLSLVDIIFSAGGVSHALTGNGVFLTNSIVQNSASVQTIALPLGFAGQRTVAGTGSLALSGIISGVGGLVKTGAGTATVNAVNTFTGGVSILGGNFALGGNNLLADTGALILNGGKFSTNGNGEAMGAFSLLSNSIIDMGSKASVISFASISDWSPTATLTVQNWTGTIATAGGTDQVKILQGATSLSTGQLANVQFYDAAGTALGQGAMVIGNELVPKAAAPTCSLANSVSNLVYNDQGTTATSDDTIDFLLTITLSGTIISTTWDVAAPAGLSGSGNYGVGKQFSVPYATFTSNVLALTVKDRVDGQCNTTATITAPTPAANVIIQTAVLDEDNNNVFDHQGETPEYIVIKNNGNTTVSLSDWTLSNDPQQPNMWQFPSATSIAGGDTKLIFASAKNRITAEPYATNFRLVCPPAPTACLYQKLALRSTFVVRGGACKPCNVAIQKGTPLNYVIPDSKFSTTGTTWTVPSYNDGQWSRGSNCIGYDGDPICDNLILYSTFNTADVDTTNHIIFDMSGPILHPGTYVPTGATVPVAGKVGQAVSFPGSGTVATASLVNYIHHSELNPTNQNYTFAIWIYPTASTGQTELIYQKMDTQTSMGYFLTRDGDAGATFGLYAGGNYLFTVRTPQNIPAQAWLQLTVVVNRDLGQLQLYRAGVLVNTTFLPSSVIINVANTKPLQLAQPFSAATQISFNGKMDEFAIWGRALPSTEVQTVVTQGVAGLSFKVAPTGQTSSPPYNTLITTDVKAAMKGVNTSAYERIPFTIPDVSLVSKLQLSINYDDGFIAYINGIKVAERNAPSSPTYTSSATLERPDTDALTAEVIDLTAFKSSLVTGAGNVLAIHGLNFGVADPRFLICPELCYEEDTANACFCSTNGRNFWLAFPGNEPDETTNPLALSVCITGVTGTTGVLTAPFYGISTPFTIPASGSVQIPIDKKLSLEKSDTIETKGIHIVSSLDVAVYARSREDYTTDSYLAIPTTCLGSEYLVLGYRNLWIGSPDLNGSEFGIVAQADNTRVTVKPTKKTNGHNAGVAYSFTLNQGQTYFLRNTDADLLPDLDDLSGSEILSDKPVAVMSGHRCANVNGLTFFCNHLVEQLLPIPLWSTEYVSTPLKTRTNDTYRVLASKNSTLVFFDGVAKAFLNRGEIFETVESVGRIITANAPVLVGQYSNSSDYDGVTTSDPFQINLQPTRSWLGSYKVCVPPASEFTHSYVNVVANSTSDIASIIISPAVISTEGPIAMFGGKAYARYEVTPNSTYTFSGKYFGLTQYGFDEYDGYGNSGGMGFQDFFPPVFATCPSDMTIYCTGNVAQCTAPMPDLIPGLGITDNCCSYASLTLRQSIAVGTALPEGDYKVTVTATDCVQNTSTCSINLHVRSNWQATNFPASYGNTALERTTWGWSADKDGDGIPNNLEYALGTDPNVPNDLSTAVKVNYVADGNDYFLEITYRRRLDDPSLEYICQGSNGLGDWTQSLGHFEVRSVVPDTLSGYEAVTERCLDSLNSRNQHYFLRIKLIQH